MIHVQKIIIAWSAMNKEYYKQFLYKNTLNGSETIVTRKFPLQ